MVVDSGVLLNKVLLEYESSWNCQSSEKDRCTLSTLLSYDEWTARLEASAGSGKAYLRTKILDFGGFDSSRILILRGGILMSMWNFPESLSQGILVGIILVGRLGVRNFSVQNRRLEPQNPKVSNSSSFERLLSFKAPGCWLTFHVEGLEIGCEIALF